MGAVHDRSGGQIYLMSAFAGLWSDAFIYIPLGDFITNLPAAMRANETFRIPYFEKMIPAGFVISKFLLKGQ
jgi:hypothetical protein